MVNLSTSRTAVRALRSLVQQRYAALSSCSAWIHTSVYVRQDASSSSSSSSDSIPSPSLTPSPFSPPLDLSPRTKPPSPSYYSGRHAYVDSILELEELLRITTRRLSLANAIPNNSPPPPFVSKGRLWLPIDGFHRVVGATLSSSQYRLLLIRLNLLARYRILVRDHLPDFPIFEETISRYMTEEAKLRGIDTNTPLKQKGHIDEFGRAYSRGRRKESSARVWIIPTKNNHPSQIIINNQSLFDYFTRTADREAVNWPFKLTGTLGAYNVFAITRGGGSTGQSGAIAHAIANALVTIVSHTSPPELADKIRAKVNKILARDGIIKRDPRMVERKKTGLAKARKAYTWVKR